MSVICPTVTASNTHEFREQIETIAHFAQRVHLDFMDGLFLRSKSPDLGHFWWPHSIPADLHMMCERPDLYKNEIVNLGPSLVIVHAEAEGKFVSFAKFMKKHGIKVGVALLQKTAPAVIGPAIEYIDHVMIFSGDLGHFGGEVDKKLLEKIPAIKKLKPTIEIGWDGGINDKNVKSLVTNGVDVLNTGGYIHKSDNPAQAYAKLISKL